MSERKTKSTSFIYERKNKTSKKNPHRVNNCIRDFPGGPVVKNPPSNAGDVGLIPGWETKIPHAAGQLSLHTLEPTCHNY